MSSSRQLAGVAKGWALFALLWTVLLLAVLVQWSHDRDERERAKHVRQRAQLHSIKAALALFDSQSGGYPPSDGNDMTGSPYCGAMKLAEAMMGQDLMGFHPKSDFRADGLDANGLTALYVSDTLPARPGAFLARENANVYRLVDIYGKGRTGPFPENAYVLCDMYPRKLANGKKAGMPILYYRARASGTAHDADNPDNAANIYDYRDNLALLRLGVPGDPNVVHPLADPRRFYLNTENEQVSQSRPYRPDSYILISAGWDGLYGTADDICNYEWKYRESGAAGIARK